MSDARLTMRTLREVLLVAGQVLLAMTAGGQRMHAQAIVASAPAAGHAAPVAVTPDADSGATWMPADTLASRVSLEIATRWRIGVERLRIDWSAVPLVTQVAAHAHFTLSGPSSSGVATIYLRATVGVPAQQLVVRAGVATAAPVAARRIARGMILSEGDITTEHVVLWGSPASTRSEVAPGWVTRRVVNPGEILRAPAVAPAPLVKAGTSVEFVLHQNGIQLSLQGIATHSASLGQPVLVRLGVNRRLSGIVRGRNRVVAEDIQRKS